LSLEMLISSKKSVRDRNFLALILDLALCQYSKDIKMSDVMNSLSISG